MENTAKAGTSRQPAQRSIARSIIGAPICADAMVNRAMDAPTRHRWYPTKNDSIAFEFMDGSQALFRFSRATLGWAVSCWAEPGDTHMFRSHAQAAA